MWEIPLVETVGVIVLLILKGLPVGIEVVKALIQQTMKWRKKEKK